MGCDVCSKEIQSGDGYVLSTTQVVTNPRYWEFYFRQVYPQQMDAVGQKGERLLALVFRRAADNTGWALCGSCVRMFSVNRRKARDYYMIWEMTRQLPSSFGTADSHRAIKAAEKGWKRVFGTKQIWDSGDPSTLMFASVHALRRAKEMKGKKWWQFWKR